MSVVELIWIVVDLQSRLFRVSAELEETRREHARARARIAELERDLELARRLVDEDRFSVGRCADRKGWILPGSPKEGS